MNEMDSICERMWVYLQQENPSLLDAVADIGMWLSRVSDINDHYAKRECSNVLQVKYNIWDHGNGEIGPKLVEFGKHDGGWVFLGYMSMNMVNRHNPALTETTMSRGAIA